MKTNIIRVKIPNDEAKAKHIKSQIEEMVKETNDIRVSMVEQIHCN